MKFFAVIATSVVLATSAGAAPIGILVSVTLHQIQVQNRFVDRECVLRKDYTHTVDSEPCKGLASTHLVQVLYSKMSPHQRRQLFLEMRKRNIPFLGSTYPAMPQSVADLSWMIHCAGSACEG